MDISLGMWVAFNAFVLAMIALDLGVFHRKAHAVSLREAATWSIVWVVLALGFGAWIWSAWGEEAGLQFLTGYLIEKSLSVDNIFVFVMLFTYFAVPAQYQHRVLIWGIIGALIMRGAFIAAGAYVLERFDWVLYVFGAILILTGLKMLRRQESFSPETNPFIGFVRRWLPMTDRYHGERFWVKDGVRWVATPLFLVLLLVEASDLVFAIDSIPAIFAVTREPFLVFTANVFAILGLRSMYFLLAGVVHRFVYLKVGLAAVLVFVGVKMMIVEFYHIPVAVSLAVILGVITGSIVVSLRKTRAGSNGSSGEGGPGGLPGQNPATTDPAQAVR